MSTPRIELSEWKFNHFLVEEQKTLDPSYSLTGKTLTSCAVSVVPVEFTRGGGGYLDSDDDSDFVGTAVRLAAISEHDEQTKADFIKVKSVRLEANDGQVWV